MAHEIRLPLDRMPLTVIAETCRAEAPFVHQDRVCGYHVLIYLRAGSAEVTEDSISHSMVPGDVLLLHSGVHHWGVRPWPAGAVWTYVHFLLPPSDRACGSYPLHMPQQEFSAADYDRCIALPKKLPIPPGTASRLDRLTALFRGDDPLRAAYMNPLLTEILLDLYGAALPRPTGADPVLRAVEALHAMTRLPFDAAALESAGSLSYKYLSTLFHRRMGMSPQAYHTRLRMHEAARLLRDTRRTVSEISDMLHFCTPQYFSRVFASVHGVSPRTYRRRFMQS